LVLRIVTAGGIAAKSALTVVAAVSATVQDPDPEHAPLQPAKRDPLAAVAVSDTGPAAKLNVHVAEQSPLLAETRPAPEPMTSTVRLIGAPSGGAVDDGAVANVASTAVALFSVTAHTSPAPQPPPDQPVKVEPD
jgi:hypothetical protein